MRAGRRSTVRNRLSKDPGDDPEEEEEDNVRSGGLVPAAAAPPALEVSSCDPAQPTTVPGVSGSGGGGRSGTGTRMRSTSSENPTRRFFREAGDRDAFPGDGGNVRDDMIDNLYVGECSGVQIYLQ